MEQWDPARSQAEATVAVVGGGRLLGQRVAELLTEEGLSPERLRLYDLGERVGRLEELEGSAALVSEADPDLLALAEQVYLCLPPEEAAPFLEAPRARGSLWLDLSGASSVRPRVPLVNLRANPEALPARPNGLVAVPGAGAQLLTTVLAPLLSLASLRRARAVLHVPASEQGQEGLDELYQQTVGLLNFSEVRREVFGAQLAFNLLPEAGEIGERARRETSRILRLGRGALTVAALRAPVFHGHAVWLHLELAERRSPEELSAALEASDWVSLAGEHGSATPLDFGGEARVLAAPFLEDGTGKGGVWLWAGCDDLTGGSAGNAVGIASACRGG
jgi:aspartate-semialdehyde dehydrogenase